MTDIVQKYKPFTSDDEQSINEYSSDEENENDQNAEKIYFQLN